MTDFHVICAVSLNGIIGDSATNSIPWYLPADLKNFKAITTGHTIVMGAKTYNSLGMNLPNRRNVVITRGNTPLIGRKGPLTPDATYTSLACAMKNEAAGFFVIGGEHIFKEALRYEPSSLYITVVHMDAVGDVRFAIEGRRFLQDAVHISDTLTYNCTTRSNKHRENEIDFEYTIFSRR